MSRHTTIEIIMTRRGLYRVVKLIVNSCEALKASTPQNLFLGLCKAPPCFIDDLFPSFPHSLVQPSVPSADQTRAVIQRGRHPRFPRGLRLRSFFNVVTWRGLRSAFDQCFLEFVSFVSPMCHHFFFMPFTHTNIYSSFSTHH